MDNLHMYYYIEESGSAEEKRSEMFIYNVGADDNGTFSCVGINVAGTSFSNYTLRVIIKEPPVVNEVSFPRDYMNYIIASSAGGGLLIFAILGTIVIKCKQRKTTNKRSKKYAMSGSGVTVTNVNGSGNSASDSGPNDTGLMKCSSIINGDVDSLNGSGGLIMSEGLTPTKLCKENGVIIGGQMKQNLLLYAPVAQYQQQHQAQQQQHLDGVTLGGPGSLQLGASHTPPPTSSLIMSSAGLAYCSPPGSVRNYQEKNPDLVHDAAESVKHQTLKNVSGSLETDFDAASDCSGPCSIQGMTITQTPVQYDNCYQLIRPAGLVNNMNSATRFTAMSTLPRGMQLKTLMSGMGAPTTLGVMTQQSTPHQVDVHLNPVCFLGQEGLMAYDYSNQHAILQQPQQQPQHILSPLQNATAQVQQHQQQQQQQHQQQQQQQQNFYRTLPHNRAHKQQQFAAATAGNNNMRYSLEAEFLQQRSNTPTYEKYLPNVRFTAEGYPQAQPQYPSPPEGYKTSSPSNIPVTSCGSLDTMAGVGSMPTFQQWPPCLPGFQVQPIRYPPTIVGVLSPQPQQQFQTPSTSLSQPLTSTSQTQTPVSDSISVAATATISGSLEIKKRCVTAQADNSIIPEGDESESVSPTNSRSTTTATTDEAAAVRNLNGNELCSASKSEQQSTTKLRHLNGPLADSPDEGYVGESQDNTDI